jgi:hypothetical protein
MGFYLKFYLYMVLFYSRFGLDSSNIKIPNFAKFYDFKYGRQDLKKKHGFQYRIKDLIQAVSQKQNNMKILLIVNSTTFAQFSNSSL